MNTVRGFFRTPLGVLLALGAVGFCLLLGGCGSPGDAYISPDAYYAQTSVGNPTVPRVYCQWVSYSPQPQCYRTSVPASQAAVVPQNGSGLTVSVYGYQTLPPCTPVNALLFGSAQPACWNAPPSYYGGYGSWHPQYSGPAPRYGRNH